MKSNSEFARRWRSYVAVFVAVSLSTTLPTSQGCGSASQLSQMPRDEGAMEGGEGFVLADDPEVPSADVSEELLTDLLRGTVAHPDDTLGSRQAALPLRVPHPPRGATARFNFDGGKRGWVTAMPNDQLLTSPAYHDGRVYLGGGFASHRFYALDAFTGESAWTLAAPDGGPSAPIVLASSLAFPRDTVIFNTESCTLFCADAATGELLWKRWLGDPLMSQPAAAGDLVISAFPTGGKHRLGAFRVLDGEPVWDIELEADVIQAPHVRNDDVFVATMDGTVLRVRARDGHVYWRRDLGATSPVWVDGDRALVTRRVDEGGRIDEQPVVLEVASGRVLSRGERVSAPYLAGDSRDRRLAASTAGAWGGVPHGEHLGLANVASGWAFQGSAPTAAEGRLYQAIGGTLVAREIATGEKLWERVYREADTAQALSPPAVVGSQLVFGTVDGKLYFSDIDTGMTIRAYDVGAPIVFQPVVAEGWVYVATGEGDLIGLEVGDPAFDGWHMWGGGPGHSGPVPTAGVPSEALRRSLARPGQGAMEVLRVSATEADAAEPSGIQAFAGEAQADGSSTEGAAEGSPESLVHRPMTMVHMRVDARITGYVARVKVTQRFENPADVPVDARYLFPLPVDSAVDDMRMHVGDRVIRAQIRSRSRARQVFEQARAAGRRAALLEQQRPNLFAQSVANIPPHASIEVELSYVSMLPFDDGEYEFVYPMVAPPRYDPHDPGAVLGTPEETRRADSIELNLSLDAGMPLASIDSPTHELRLTRPSASQAQVQLPRSGQLPNRDFVLRYAVGGSTPDAALFATRDAQRGHFSLVLQPPAVERDDDIAPRHLTLLVDTSSSMRGRPMAQARALVERLVDGLRPQDTVDLLAFGDRVSSLAEAPLSGGASLMPRVRRWLQGLRPVGSTEMEPAVRTALERNHRGPGLGMVVLVTDGFVGNEAEVLRAIAEHLGASRLYALGVGSAVNRFLLERAAELGRGRAVVSTLSEEPAAAAGKLSRMIAAPVFTDVVIDWGDLEVSDVYPRRLPDLFRGAPLVVHGRFVHGGRGEIKIRGTYHGQRYERVVQVQLPEGDTAGANAEHATLWARAAVHDRINSLTLRPDEDLVQQVRALGLCYRLVTPYTSFVAVDERTLPADESDAKPEARATLSPGRTLPGDPEIRIPAPPDALAVTVVLPFGETLAATYEPRLGLWTARFLVPADAEEGTYPVYVRIALPGGERRSMRLWYTVDSSAPQLDFEIEGEVRPGADVLIHARQHVTRADLDQVGMRRETLSPEQAVLLSDANGLELVAPDGHTVEMREVGPGAWDGVYHVPDDARGTLRLVATVVDLAANVRTQALELRVQR